MVNSLTKHRIYTNLKYFLSTLLIGELFVFSIKKILSPSLLVYNLRYIILTIFFTILAVFFYQIIQLVKRIVSSKRIDIIFSILIPICLVYDLHPFIGKKIYYIYSYLNIRQDWGTILIFFTIYTICVVCLIFLTTQKPIDKSSLFLSDDPEKDPNNDYLEVNNHAKKFAEQILNNDSNKSIVFGLDAPWGSGKSTYINFCKKFWESKDCKKKVILFTFEALRFENREKLFNIFVKELQKVIHKNLFIPEISGSLNEYLKAVGTLKFNFKNLDFSLNTEKPEDDIFEELREKLLFLDKKIIIIIDDLDRLDFEEIKTIIDIVKKSFVLPNLTYILSYDTENIKSSDGKLTKEKIIEYFEKVVNIKKTLIVQGEKLNCYYVDQIKKIEKLSDNSEEFIEKVTNEISEIFKSNIFYKYIPFLGDIRKIKRIINLLIMIVNIPEEKSYLEKRDINSKDLIHLILLYINYPKIFRDIYINEIDTTEGMFSLKWTYSTSQTTYENTEEYKNYINRLESDREKFLIDKVFNSEKFKNSSPTSKEATSLAAFNGTIGTGKNLVTYLKFIALGQLSGFETDFTFHEQNVNKFLKEKVNLQDIFKQVTFYQFTESNNGDKYRSLFFDTLFKRMNEIDFDRALLIIQEILNLVKSLSSMNSDTLEIKCRKELILELINLLNKKGWKSENNYSDNTNNKIIEISKIIFGDDNYSGKGILDTLSEKSRGILGFYDLLHFRLYCCEDRNGGFYNLYHSLLLHSDPHAQLNGNVQELTINEMREISQKCFSIFKNQYIDTKKNIFEEVYNLSQKNLLELSEKFIWEHKHFLKNELKTYIELTKNTILSFTLYQISNTKIGMGIGCGFYNMEDKEDKKEIHKVFNNYLFDVCFNIQNNPKNGVYFINYLLTQLTQKSYNSTNTHYEPLFEGFTDILDAERLKDYWRYNGGSIKKIVNISTQQHIYTYNYTANYAQDLIPLFDILDQSINT